MQRMDYIFISSPLVGVTQQARIIPAFKTDHSFPSISIQPLQLHKGPGYWKLNVSFLQDIDFCDKVKDIIREKSDMYEDIYLRWEIIKMAVRGLSIEFGTRKKKSLCNQLAVLQKKLDYLETQQSKQEQTTPFFFNQETQITLIKKEIEELIAKSTSKATLNCKQNWYEYGEKASKYFFSLEKSLTNKKTIHSLRLDNGKVTGDKDKILQYIGDFYEKLYTSNPEIKPTDAFFDDINVPRIKQDDKEFLEGPITLEEVKIALKQMNTNKCPGLDGCRWSSIHISSTNCHQLSILLFYAMLIPNP